MRVTKILERLAVAPQVGFAPIIPAFPRMKQYDHLGGNPLDVRCEDIWILILTLLTVRIRDLTALNKISMYDYQKALTQMTSPWMNRCAGPYDRSDISLSVVDSSKL